jgi:hypothetical protein
MRLSYLAAFADYYAARWLKMTLIKSNAGKFLLLAVMVLLLAAATSAQTGGWQKVAGGDGTVCSDGSPYSFYVHPGNYVQGKGPGKGRNLLIYFQGGGACWSGPTCNPRVGLYRPNLKEVDPANERGIFDFNNAENPFRNYAIVFVPYCTGDVHLGNRTATYTEPRLPLHHNGFNNAMAALRWTFANIPSPQSIFVAGGSAGAMASPFYAGRIAEHYKDARVVQLGDSAGGLAGPINTEMFQSWGTMEVLARFPPYKSLEAKNANLVTLYVREGLANKSITFAQFNNSADSLQVFAFQVFGVETPLREVLEKSYAQIRSEMPRFHTYTATGTLHVILTRPEFYTVAVERRRLRDWVAELASGNPPADVPAR